MLSPSRMISLAMPLLLAYLTYDSIGGSLKLASQLAQVTPSAHRAKTVDGAKAGETDRNPFSQQLPQEMAELLGSSLPSAGGEEEEGKDEPRLNGTVIMGKLRIAILNGQRVHQGDLFRGMELAAVAQDRVILVDRSGHNVILRLDVATSDEVQAVEVAKKSPEVDRLAQQPPLQRGLSALTAGSQGDILDMLGIPKN